VLAATLSPAYGIYSGFESFENVPVREGSEEYLDSEKYEAKRRKLDGPLLPLVAANVTRTPNAEFLATPDNIAASEAVCKLPEVAAADCAKFMAPVIEAMKAAPPGTFVLPTGEHAVDIDVRDASSPSRGASPC